MSTKSASEARVAQANKLHSRMDAVPSSLAEFNAIAQEYEALMGLPMLVRAAVVDEVMAHANQHDLTAAWEVRDEDPLAR